MFTVVQGSPQSIWCPVASLDTLYVGQIVQMTAANNGRGAEGLSPLGAAAGVADTTANKCPFGVVIGTNNKIPEYSTTYKNESITDVRPSSNAYEHHVGVEGPMAKMARVDMVKVAIITPETVLRGRIFDAVYGTALTVGTVTTDGNRSCTTSTIGNNDPTYVKKGWWTMYVRSGRAQGQYRILDCTSSTSLTWTKNTHVQVATSDTVVAVNARPYGLAHIQFDAESMFVDGLANASSNSYSVFVHRLDLSKAGEEYIEFRFGGDHFAEFRT